MEHTPSTANYFYISDQKGYSEIPIRFIKSGKTTLKIDLNKVEFIVAQGNYSKIFFEDQKPVLLAVQLNKIKEHLLKGDFIRVHRSYIISVKKIDKIEDNIIYIKNHNFPIGKSFKQSFYNSIENLLIIGNGNYLE